jgi:carboxymethylenebutenolidase
MKILGLVVILALCLGAAGCVANTNPGQTSPATASATVNISSSGKSYPAYVSAPVSAGKYPGIVLLHSFNGLEPGYLPLVDMFASEGFVVIAPQWQTFNKSPDDEEVQALVESGISYLKTRPDVDARHLGLTGFCAGGRYTMLFLPQMKDFRSGVAWYGFPYSGGFANETRPIDHVGELSVPMLMIHGSSDQASPVPDIYKYAEVLNQSGKYFELKVYQGEPHGFMVQNGQMNGSDVARNALKEMVEFFNRTLKGPGISL